MALDSMELGVYVDTLAQVSSQYVKLLEKIELYNNSNGLEPINKCRSL